MNASSRKHSRFSSLLIVTLLGCCAVLTLSSCSKKASVAIIGKWHVRGTGETVEFRKDGTFTNPGGGGNADNGTYTFTDDSHMKMEISDTNAPPVLNCAVKIHGDAMDMTMTFPGENNPHTLHFKRVK